ncbi:MAG: divergent polysaccharide deacetylase family protein [Nitratireductor sp.]|nr:divergent polysaccharide deacetylase family protein [Nitratireductor sp.]
MADDLNRPLGVRPEPGPRRKRRGGNVLGIAAIALAAIAIGLTAYLAAREPQTLTLAGNPAATAGDPAGQGGTAAGPVNQGNEEPAMTGAEDRGNEEGATDGLTVLQPDGNIAVPRPRPPDAEPQEAGLAHLPDPDLAEQGATGVVPKRGPDGRRPMDVYAREPDTTGNFGVARVVLIVGGIGISQTSSHQAIRDLPPTVNLAFAASGNSLARWMQEARRKGHELLLQVPMEPFGAGGGAPGSHMLSSEVSAEENIANLHWAMSRVTNYVGIMNYQGARFLADAIAAKPVFDEIAERGLLFVDDGSSGANQSEAMAKASILPYGRAFLVLDQRRTRQDIAHQLEALVKEAKRTGIAIGVSNGFPETIEMLAEFARKAGELGVEITPVSAIVNDPERDG